MGTGVSHHANHDRPGPLRRFWSALTDRFRLTAADMPERAPLDASHWEPEPAPIELPQVSLPRAANRGEHRPARASEVLESQPR